MAFHVLRAICPPCVIRPSRALLHTERLYRASATGLAERFLARPHSRTGKVTAAFLSDVESPIWCFLPLPPPSCSPHNIYSTAPYLGKKDLTSRIFVQCLVADYLTETFPDHHRVFTDGSVDFLSDTATAAVTIPSLFLEYAGHLNVTVS